MAADEPAQWMERAVRDLSDAEYTPNGGRFETTAFLSQQAAEALENSKKALSWSKKNL